MRSTLLLAIAVAFVLGVTPFAAPAADSCSTCTGEPQNPEAQSFLAGLGYPSTQYSVLLSWSERAQDGSGVYVTGFHVKPLGGGATFDLYSDGVSRLLTNEEVAALRIPAKKWDLPPVEKMAELPPAVAKVMPSKPVPVGVSKSIEPRGGEVLPEIDWAAVAREDAAAEEKGKGAKRIGVFVDLEQAVAVDGSAVSSGEWVSVDGGSLWSFAMLSPDALGIRVHFADLELPAGARITVYNGDDATEAYGPYTGPAAGESELWSATVFSESVVVECFVPDSADRDAVDFTIDRITHNYVPFGELGMAKGAGACELSVACYSGWATAATGVAGIGSVGATGSLWCTGSLLGDTDNSTTTPYFLTANHCVGSQNSASSIEAYWLYQASSCGGSVPSPSSVPRTTGGATLLATTNVTSGTDFCLLRLNGTVPNGIAYLGWSSSAAAVGTGTVCIHHPAGDYKRISFSDITNVAESLLNDHPRTRFHQNTWRVNLGVTEPGSSGSPLFIENTQQVIGQLWGGPSYCGVSASGRLDYYGRFDVSFPLMESYLDPDTTIAGTITVEVPDSSKTWKRGTKRRIRWSYTGNIGANVKVALYQNGSFVQNIRVNTANDGKVAWTIPVSLPAGSGYFIRITAIADATILDNSDSFAIKS